MACWIVRNIAEKACKGWKIKSLNDAPTLVKYLVGVNNITFCCIGVVLFPRFQSLTKVPVWEVLQPGTDRNHGALWGRQIHPNEHPGWIQVKGNIIRLLRSAYPPT